MHSPRNTSWKMFVSPPARVNARLWKTTRQPSSDIDGEPAAPLPNVDVALMLHTYVVPDTRSLTNTSATPLVSPSTRLVARLVKATKRPSADTTGSVEEPL